MANQLTGGWRRPWTASRGSSRQPAWPVQLSETPHEATRHPLRAKAPLGYLGLHGLGPARSQQPPARGSAAQYYPRRQLAAAAHCLTEHRFPCPQTLAMRGATYAPPGEEGGSSPHVPPFYCYLKYTGKPPFLPRRRDRSGRGTFWISLPPASPSRGGTCPSPEGPALWKRRRFFPGVAWAVGTAALCRLEVPRT